jgi:hypothetical protein
MRLINADLDLFSRIRSKEAAILRLLDATSLIMDRAVTGNFAGLTHFRLEARPAALPVEYYHLR